MENNNLDISNQDIDNNNDIVNNNNIINNSQSLNKDLYIEDDEENNNNNSIYPYNFNAELYNLETNTLRPDKVREYIDNQQKQIDDLTNQKNNLRRIISKGLKQPDLGEYQSYKPDSKYIKNYEDEDTKDFFNNFNQLSFNIGLNTEQHKQILDYINNKLEQYGIFDTRTEAEIELQKQDWRREQYKMLGDNAEQLIKKNMNFIDSYNFINEEQKQSLKDFANSNASNLMIINRFRELLDINFKEESEIPTMTNAVNSGLPDDITLWNEFINPNTTDYRKQQIIEDRIKANRGEWRV